MTPVTAFVVVAALLVAATVAILVLPLWRAPKVASGADQRQFNLSIFRDQLAELERDRSDGTLAEADFEQARSELQRRLLDEVRPEAAAATADGGGRKTALALVAAIPLLATAGYLLLGNPRALDPLQTQPPSSVSTQQIEGMLVKLAEKLKKDPDDANGWVMLARSYKALGRLAEAAEAYSHAGALVDQDAALLSDYAETLSQVNGGRLQGKPGELIARALKIDPEDPQSLFMAGLAASERSDFGAAADHWSRLLTKIDPGSEDYATLEDYIAKARKAAGQPSAVEKKAKSAAAAPSISGQVVLSGKLAGQAKPDDVLFVFARAEEGPRMPLAAIRATVAELPLTFRLDDSMALPGGKKLSEFKTVRIEARIAKSGKAQTASGDLFGGAGGVKLGSRGVQLTIDQVQP
ncbi:MAG: c-type cytochrome biogenesis protein CcmI [Betaproteobacteria bacterium]|nr:c-type cytochrome biogenesis protein CcmI [Betaproteobacteria bacterium]